MFGDRFFVVEDRNRWNREKKVDTGIATLMTKDAYTRGDPESDTFILVAGDADYVPLVRELTMDGFRVEVAFWRHAARELKACASRFIELDPFLEHLRHDSIRLLNQRRSNWAPSSRVFTTEV